MIMRSVFHPLPRFRRWQAALLLLAASCAGLQAVGPIALKIGKSLLDAATANYSSDYGDAINELWRTMTTPSKSKSADSKKVTAPPGDALELDVGILKEVGDSGETSLVAIEDGEVLHDGEGVPEAGDKFKLSFRANRECYVYALAIDGTGWVTPIFPGQESSRQNPVAPGQAYLVPEGSRWYALDEYRGVEHIYLLASFERRADLEERLARFAGMVRPERTEYRAVKEASVAKRGIVAVGPGTPTRVESESGEAHEVTPTSFLADVDGIDLVITRWFRHE